MKRSGTRPLSLRTKLLALTLFIVLVLSCLCAYILASEYHSVRKLSASLLASEAYDGFYSAFTRLQVSFNLYANSLNRTHLEDCRDMLGQMRFFLRENAGRFPQRPPGRPHRGDCGDVYRAYQRLAGQQHDAAVADVLAVRLGKRRDCPADLFWPQLYQPSLPAGHFPCLHAVPGKLAHAVAGSADIRGMYFGGALAPA